MVTGMILSDREILEAVKKGKIHIYPFKKENVGPCSVDLTLSSQFKIFKKNTVVSANSIEDIERNTVSIDTKNKPFTIEPGQFVLGKTREKIAISKDLAATLEGRSSIARFGIVVHAAGLVNPGSGLKNPVPQVLEVFCQNSSPVKLHPGMKIVQMIFHRLTSESRQGYDERKSSKFVGQA